MVTIAVQKYRNPVLNQWVTTYCDCEANILSLKSKKATSWYFLLHFFLNIFKIFKYNMYVQHGLEYFVCKKCISSAVNIRFVEKRFQFEEGNKLFDANTHFFL